MVPSTAMASSASRINLQGFVGGLGGFLSIAVFEMHAGDHFVGFVQFGIGGQRLFGDS